MAPRLNSVRLGERLRGLGIIRVSKLGARDADDIESPGIQRDAILGHAAQHDIDMVEWVEAIDESGSQARSKWWAKLDAAIERVEQGHIDVIVVWKFSRVARDRYKRHRALHLVKAAGGRIDSAAVEGDDTTAVGKLTRGMVGEFDAFYADMISEGWRETQSRRVAQGLPHAGKLPWGWRWEGKKVVPHPDQAPYVIECYERFLAGASARELSAWLNSMGQKPNQSPRWSNAKIRPWLDSPIHAGLISYHGELLEGAHEGLIDRDTWERYRKERRGGPRRARTYLLSGVATCGTCRGLGLTGVMGGYTSGPMRSTGKQVAYGCRAARGASLEERTEHGPWSITARVLEGALRGWLAEIAADVENKIMLREIKARPGYVDTAQLQREIDVIDEKIADIYEQLREEVLPKPAYDKLRDRYMARRADLSAGIAETERLRSVAPENPSAAAAELLAEWDTLAVSRRRDLIKELVREVRVDWSTRTAQVIPAWRNEDPRPVA